MESTFQNFGVAFRGKNVFEGVPAYVENGGIRTVGGFISPDNETNAAKFGRAVFAVPGKEYEFFIGSTDKATATLFRGILLNRPMVNEQMSMHADELLVRQPADAIYQGSVWVKLTNSSPAVGHKVFAATDGTLNSGASTGTGTDINARVVEHDDDDDLWLIYLG